MKKFRQAVQAVLAVSIVSLVLPGTALAKGNIPIMVAKQGGEISHTGKTAYMDKIQITETAPDSFSKQKQYAFSVRDMEFAQGQIVKTEGSNVSASLGFQQGNCVLTINSSDDTKIETVTLDGVSVLSKKYDILPVGSYALYLDSQETGKIALLEEFVTVSQSQQEPKKEKMDMTLQVGSKTFSVNGQQKSMLVPAYISDAGYTMLPVREVAKIFPKTEAYWQNETKTATFRFADRKAVAIKAGAGEMEISGKKKKLQTKAEMKDGRMFVSLRDIAYICDIPNGDIQWNQGTKTVTINTTLQAQ